MSLITKITLGVVAILILALSIESYIVHTQNIKIKESVAQMKELTNKVEVANKTVKTQAVVAEVTDEVVTNATKRITTNTKKGVAIKAVVDNVTKRVANEEISSVVADTAYNSSMWDAYCSATTGDSACSAR